MDSYPLACSSFVYPCQTLAIMRSSFVKTLRMVLGDSSSVVKFRWALVFLDCIAAIHDNHLPGQIRSRIRCKESNRCRDLFRPPGPSNGRIFARGNPSSIEDAVSIQPGATAFTVMPLRATSNARLRVR